MAKAKGAPKTGGRVKGVPNKNSVPLKETAERLGIDPFEILLLFAKGDWEKLGYDSQMRVTSYTQAGDPIENFVIEPSVRSKAAAEASSYLYPKRKAIEHSGKIDPALMEAAEQMVALPTDALIKLIQEELKKAK